MFFLTAADFSAGKLYYIHTGKNGSASSDYDLLTKKKIVIDQSGSVNQIDKNNIYALQDCSGKIIRIYKGGYYTLLNPGADIPVYMTTQFPASKGDIVINKYYFSKNPNAEIKELTVDNLKAEFTDFHQFNHAMDTIYKADKELFAGAYSDNSSSKTPTIKSDEK